MVKWSWIVTPLLVLVAAVVTLAVVSGASPTTKANVDGKGYNPKCSRKEIMSCVFPVWKTIKTKYDLLRSSSRLEFTEKDFGNVCATLRARINPCMQKLDATCGGYTLHAIRSLNNTLKYMCNAGWGEFQEFKSCYTNSTNPIVRNKVRQCYQKSGLAHRDFFDSEKDMYQAYQTDWWYRNRRDDFLQEHVDQDRPKPRQPYQNHNSNDNNEEFDDSEYGQRIHQGERGYPGPYTSYLYHHHPALRHLPLGHPHQPDEFGRYGMNPEDVYGYREVYHRNYYDFGYMYPFFYGYPHGPYYHPFGHYYNHHPPAYPWPHPACVILHQPFRYGPQASVWSRENGGRRDTNEGGQMERKESDDDARESHVSDDYARLRNYNYATCKGFEMMMHCASEFKNQCSKEDYYPHLSVDVASRRSGQLFLWPSSGCYCDGIGRSTENEGNGPPINQ